jgi:hypothetical protein
MAHTAGIDTTAWNNPMFKQIRKTFAIATLIVGSAAVAMLLFGNERDGVSLAGSAARALRNISGLFGGIDPIIVGVGVGIAMLVGIAFWVRGR